MRRFKPLLLAGLRLPGVAGTLRRLIRDRATIFMLHRLEAPDLGVRGGDPEHLRASLEYLRRNRYELLPLGEVFRRLRDGAPLERVIAFTIDDGYLDQAEIAAPIFAAYDCPVTTFVCSGFLDGALWMWWDRIEYVFEHTARNALRVPLDGAETAWEWSDPPSRLAAQLAFIEACKRVSNEEKLAAVERLAEAAEVELPERAPRGYTPMSWDQLRDCEEGGMRFGPHTLTHPVLSRVGDEQARREIVESARRLESEAKHPDRLFCYPNGQRGDFGAREFDLLDELGFEGAVVGYPGYAERFGADDPARFGVRRFALPDALDDLVQCVSGFERAKSLLRSESAC